MIFVQRKSLYRHVRLKHCNHNKAAMLEKGEKNPQKKYKATETTLPTAKDAFLVCNAGDFSRLFSAGEDITWRELPKCVVYLVQKLACLETWWGQRTMLHLSNNYTVYKVWTPDNIADIITDGYTHSIHNDFRLYITPSDEKVPSIVLQHHHHHQAPPASSLPLLQSLEIHD